MKLEKNRVTENRQGTKRKTQRERKMEINFANVFARVRMPAVVLAHTGWNEEREWE